MSLSEIEIVQFCLDLWQVSLSDLPALHFKCDILIQQCHTSCVANLFTLSALCLNKHVNATLNQLENKIPVTVIELNCQKIY